MAVIGESESFCKSSSISEEKSVIMPEGSLGEFSSALHTELPSSVSTRTERHRAGQDRKANQGMLPWIPDGGTRDPEVIYDDVPVENLQHSMEGDYSENKTSSQASRA